MNKTLKIKAFGITKDILGKREVEVTLTGDNVSVGSLRNELEQKHPRLKELRSLLIAVNNNYASDEDALHENDEIALIPPVSGG